MVFVALLLQMSKFSQLFCGPLTARQEHYARTGVVRSAKSQERHDNDIEPVTLDYRLIAATEPSRHHVRPSISRLEAMHLPREACRLRTTVDWSHTAEDTAEMGVGRRKPQDCDNRRSD
jgi:hypothetical protein